MKKKLFYVCTVNVNKCMSTIFREGKMSLTV